MIVSVGSAAFPLVCGDYSFSTGTTVETRPLYIKQDGKCQTVANAEGARQEFTINTVTGVIAKTGSLGGL